MDFIDTYEKLDSICRTRFNSGSMSGVSAYIHEMERIGIDKDYTGKETVDYTQLKHYRAVWNILDKEYGYTEEELCSPADVLWINEFCESIKRNSDPVGLKYRQIKGDVYARALLDEESDEDRMNSILIKAGLIAAAVIIGLAVLIVLVL